MFAVVQLRGPVNASTAVRDTLEMLHLGRVNHCTLVPDAESYRGMVTKVTDFVAYGEPSEETIDLVLRRRAEPVGGSQGIDDEWVADATSFEDVRDLAGALAEEAVMLDEVGLEPVLRLHPPRGGHAGIKRHRTDGGQLGPHDTDEIDDLLHRMR